ncbi:MAG: S8 family serine peptidase [Acidobacteriota bacterium]
MSLEEQNDLRKTKRPNFRPRVVVKFHDWVDVPYVDGAEKAIAERFGAEPWKALHEQFGGVSLIRLYTSLSPDRIEELLAKASERDDSYEPPNLFTWYTVDAPANTSSKELAEHLLRWEIVEKAYPDARAVDPMPVSAADDPRWPDQGYLDPAPEGIDAEFAWTIAGGDGAGQRFIDLEQGWTLNHEDLDAHGASLLFGTLVNSSRPHGTAVLGEVCAVDNALGCVGITPNIDSVDVVSHSGSLSNVSDAILAAVDTLDFGHVLLLEVQTVPSAAPVFGAPVELIDDIFESIRLATALGVVVVEAAGNGSNNLDTVTNAGGLQVLNPASADFRDSGAIIVGSAFSAAPHGRWVTSSFGARVDCYGWGHNIETTSSTSGGSTTAYTSGFGGTSGASPIITGAALAVQGIVEASVGHRLSPAQIRQILSDPATGTASADPPVDQIGVMPDLQAIITTTLGIGLSDVYLRDNPGDIGDPHGGSISASPDVIVRPNTVPDPQTAYGEGSSTENNSTLGYEVESGQDNFIYTRVRNRGAVAATNAEVTVYWSEVATLITPDMWNLVGSTVIPNVPVGDILTVADAIVWSAADIPATGHYCFVAIVGTADDPAPPLANLLDFDNFRTFIRENNNVTWRNFNVVNTVPDPMDPGIMMEAQIAGAPKQAVGMGLEVIARLPADAKLVLEAPLRLLARLGYDPNQIDHDGELGRVALQPQGRQALGKMRFPAKFRAKLRLIANLPKDKMKQTGYRVVLRQFLADDEEVGRVTWFLAAPEWFERRKRQEKCLFGG